MPETGHAKLNSVIPNDRSSAGALRLADHVRSCAVDDQVVLLDLKNSRYLSLSRHHWNLLQDALRDWNSQPDAARPLPTLFAPLIRQGHLAAASIDGKQLPLIPVEPTTSFDAGADSRAVSLRLRHLAAFGMATSLAALWLRSCSLRYITRQVESRHRDCTADTIARSARLRDAVTAFDRLRPLVFTSREKCLYDSLALVMFLARQGLVARWIMGVTTKPFRAHSWVQDGHEVLNDLHDNVRRYTPIHCV